MPDLILHDSSLRDGNHAVKHQLSAGQIRSYCHAADAAGLPVVEVGHGNGLGASSLQVGLCRLTDREMLETARAALLRSRLAVHVMPGFATVKADIAPAVALGVDVFRVGCHCTEADTTQRHIDAIRSCSRQAIGALMMCHMADKEVLAEEAYKLQSYGAEAVMLYDSAGAFLPGDVTEKVGYLVARLDIPVGFHGHNNLGLGVANALAAAAAGAGILDGSARGFGAGAGNVQIEVLAAVLSRLGYETGVDLYGVLDLGELAEREIIGELPRIGSLGVVSGLAGVFSGFAKHVERLAAAYAVDPRDVFFELGRRKVVAGQEDLILEVAAGLAARCHRDDREATCPTTP
jgi:4-hydroxy 2-oxovalerate aldolase